MVTAGHRKNPGASTQCFNIVWFMQQNLTFNIKCSFVSGKLNEILYIGLPQLHLKDYVINDDNQPTFAEIGNGNLDWPRIIAAADEVGCEWFIVEQDTCAGDPFDSVKASFDYLQEQVTCT